MDLLNRCFDTEKFYIRMNEMVKKYIKYQDFEGQKLAEKLYKIILILSLIIAMGVSYSTQHLCHGVYIMIGGLVSSIILCIPSWPMYNRNHLNWLKHKVEKKEKKE